MHPPLARDSGRCACCANHRLAGNIRQKSERPALIVSLWVKVNKAEQFGWLVRRLSSKILPDAEPKVRQSEWKVPSYNPVNFVIESTDGVSEAQRNVLLATYTRVERWSGHCSKRVFAPSRKHETH